VNQRNPGAPPEKDDETHDDGGLHHGKPPGSASWTAVHRR